MIQTRQAVSDSLTSAQAAMARCQRLRGIVLRIVLVLHSHIVGGIERHALSLMQGLRERGHEVAFAGPLDGWLGRAATAQDFTVLHLPMRGYYDLPSLIRLVRFARHYRAELLHGHSQRGSHYAGWAARLCGLPSLATAHSPKSWKYFGVANRIIAVSVSVRDMLVRRNRALARIEVVYNGVPDLVREHVRDLGLGVREREQAARDVDVAAGEREGVGFLHLDDLKAVVDILAGRELCETTAKLLDISRQVGVVDDPQLRARSEARPRVVPRLARHEVHLHQHHDHVLGQRARRDVVLVQIVQMMHGQRHF